jgi:serine/threonine protein kinase
MIGTGRQPVGHILHQRYRLLHTVGQGGMGVVYAAQDTQLGDRLVAVKEMSMSRLTPQDVPQAVEQFRREAHLLAGLHHPNLPVIHEYFREDDRWYLVMSFIEGQNLQVALNAAPGNRLPVSEVVRLGIELCDVLEYLHTHEPQVIFRDLKPLNIMLTSGGHICLIDFGIARHFKQEQIKDTAYYYSVGYAPPEQYGQSQTGPRSDIYNLGATLHQTLSGQNPVSRPFQFTPLQMIDPTIPMPLAKLVMQMLEMSEQARPSGATEVKGRLENILTPKQR